MLDTFTCAYCGKLFSVDTFLIYKIKEFEFNLRSKGIVREKPEELLVFWIKGNTMKSRQAKYELNQLVCDLCNKKLNWEPFPVICFPSDEEIADIDHIPAGGTALCQSCALKEYGLKDCDAGKVDRLWVCFDMTEII